MKMKTRKRFLAAFLALAMVLSLVPSGILRATAAEAGKIDVWDFGAEELDTSKYNNMLTADEINSWYPDVEAGTTGKNIASFTTTDGQLSFNDGGYSSTHRLRVKDASQGITCYDTGKYLQDANGTVYTGYLYSNKSATSAVYLSIEATAGDILTFVLCSNGTAFTANLEAPSGAVQTYAGTPADSKDAKIATFYATETGTYKLYYTQEKMVVARIYRESTNTVTVSGTVTAPEGLTGYSIVFTNTASGAVVTVPVEDGTYTASLNDGYSYEVSLADANGYIIVSGKTLTIEKGAESASLDVQIIAVNQVTVSGNITGLDEATLAKLSLTLQSDAIYQPVIEISGTAYTVDVEVGQEYTLAAEGVNDYQITSGTTLTYTEDTTTDIVFEAKPVYNVTIVPDGCTAEDLAEATFTFTNLNEEGYVYSFTGTEGIALRDGVYSVAVSNSGVYVQQLTSNLKVNGADVTKTISFSSNITEWDFRTDDFTGQSPYNGLVISGSFNKHGTSYGMQIKNATIEVPVSGSCEIQAAVGYNWDITFPDGTNYFDNTNSGDITLSYTYTGSAGTATITVGGQCTSYIKYIKIIETVPYQETVTVGASGCDYTTVGDALDAVRAMERPNNERVTISIQPGNYEEMLVIDVPNVTLVNASANPSLELTNQGVDIDVNAVRITSYYGHGYTYYSMGSDCKYDETILQVNKENGYASFVNPGSGTTSGSYWNATVVVTADGFQASGIIFENSFNQYVSEKAADDVIVAQSSAKEGSTPRASLPAGSTAVQEKAYVERAAALAIGSNCNEIFFDNCKFVGRQDTLYGGTGVTAAFYGCSIYGACDYIFGGMTAVFAKCDLVFNTSEDGNDVGYITAAQTASGSHGLLMYNCNVTSTTPGVDTASAYTSKPGYYGRPWAAGTGEAVFYYTVVDASDSHWYDISPSLIRSTGWLSTLGGESALCGEYGTYEYALDVDNSASRAAWASVFETETLADGSAISVETFLDDWDAFAGKDMTIEIPTEKVDNAPADDTGSTTVFTLDVTNDVASMPTAAKADGDTDVAGTEDYFTIIYSSKTKVDSSSKTFDDGYTATQRINFGGKTDTDNGMINSVMFTTSNSATVKIWWVSGGDGREMAIYDASGTIVATTDASASTKNSLYIDTLTVDAAGTYYLGVPSGSNYLFQIEVTEDVAAEPVEYVLDATLDLTAFAQGDKADGDTEVINDFFTIIYSSKNKVDSSSKTFDDGYTATQRLNFGGKTDTANGMLNSVMFTTTGAATVKIWWVSGGDGREMAIYDASGVIAATTDASASIKNGLYIDELTLEDAGTYYLGVPTGSNYLFKVSVTVGGGSTEQPERAAWDTVEVPVIASAVQDSGNISVTVSANVGYDGGDALVVTMYNAEGNAVTSKRSIAEKTEHTLTFTPDASGEYTFTAVLSREEEEDKTSESVSTSFILPLKAPYIYSATSTGGGKINVVWGAVTEAESYEVYCDGVLAATTSQTEYEVTDLTIGTKYSFTVVAVRGEDKSAASDPVAAEATSDAQVVWGFTTYGSSTSTSSNGYILHDDGTVTVYSEGGKGKLVPNSTDGVAFYYTAIPTEYNFTLRATVTVDSWTFTNGQEGFGLLAADRLGPHGESAAFWNNQYMASVTKNEYTIDGTKYTMKLGVNTIAKTGVTTENLPLLEVNDTETVAKDFSSVSTTLETYAYDAGKGAGTYNIVGNYTADPGGTMLELTTFVLEIQKNNTGYFITYYDADGNVIGKVKNYDPDALNMVDTENVYVGFFASRNARVTVSDVELTTILASEDAPAEEKPVTYVTPTVAITSASTANSADYTVYISANVSGTASITVDGTLAAENVAVTAGKRCDVDLTLAPGTNKIEVTLTPDPDQDLGADTELASTDPVAASLTVTYTTTWADQNNLYVSPSGVSTAAGTKDDPLDIYTAVSYVQPGQMILLMEGTYQLTQTVRIEHGIDGTADANIYMIADPEASSRPVLDFQGACAGIVHGGDYWYFQSFDVTNSKASEKGFQVSGHHNTLDQINTYKNGNTGIQISRYASTDPKSEWPSYNLILNCTSYNNADPGYEDADGFAAKLTCGEGNVFDGCVAYHNADDGWDLYAKVETGPIGSVTIRNCVAYENGYVEGEDGTLINAGNGNGFKMGGESISGQHTLINSYSFFNKAKGFDSNSCPDIIVYNSTSYNNESYNVAFYTNNAANTNFIAQGILSFKDETVKSGYTTYENLKPKGTQDTSLYLNDTNHYWLESGSDITADMFVTLEFQGVLRNEDGTIDLQGFLQLKDDVELDAGAVPGGTESAEITVVPDTSENPDPTDPSEEPTDPSKEPTEPSEEPTDPSEEPTDPSEEPTDPSEEPTEPSEEPTEPSEEPTEPSEEPTDPSEEPTVPSEESTESSEAPTVPSESTEASEDSETTEATKATESTGSNSDTGDPSMILFWLMLLAVSGLAVFGLILDQHKRRA